MSLGSDLALANRLADAASAAIRPFFRARFGHEAKADASPVTEADHAAEAAMRRLLEMEAPRDGIIGEEYGAERAGAARQWVLDPIDGTVSFMAGRPIFGTLVALLVDGSPLIGIIDQPVSGERWVGVVGQRTLFNGEPIATRVAHHLSEAALATTSPGYFSDNDRNCFVRLASRTARDRMLFGGDCYNYGLLASGTIDLVVEAGLKLHDFAALVPVVEGAGGMMRDWRGAPLGIDSDGHVIAVGDPARLEDVIDALADR